MRGRWHVCYGSGLSIIIIIILSVAEISLEKAELAVYESELYVSVCVELKSDLECDIDVILIVKPIDATRK